MIDPRLLHESLFLGKLSLCHVLFKNDTRFPWAVLVPEVPHLMDFHEMSAPQQHQACEEITRVSLALKALWPVDKINIAALGNLVPQCHIHVVGRRRDDPLWPHPIWGKGACVPYDPRAIEPLVDKLCLHLNLPL